MSEDQKSGRRLRSRENHSTDRSSSRWSSERSESMEEPQPKVIKTEDTENSSEVYGHAASSSIELDGFEIKTESPDRSPNGSPILLITKEEPEFISEDLGVQNQREQLNNSEPTDKSGTLGKETSTMPVDDKKKLEPGRKRARNFTAEEEALLINLVEKHKHIIKNKKTNASIWKQKEEAWLNIADEYAAKSGIHRHYKALRDKFESLKRKPNGEMPNKKLETCRTRARVTSSLGGESATHDSDSQIHSDKDVTNNMDFERSVDGDKRQITCEEIGEYDGSMPAKNDSPSCRPSTSQEAKAKVVADRTKQLQLYDQERKELIILQQKFYEDENRRAQEKHDQEMLNFKYKNELLELELAEKKSKLL